MSIKEVDTQLSPEEKKFEQLLKDDARIEPVSYTHLTLPTILLV